jgi:hypothetical protein
LRGREIRGAPLVTLPRKRGREGPTPQAWEGGGEHRLA